MRQQALKVNLYAIVDRAVEEGVAYGFQRAHKHTNEPDPKTIKAEIEKGVMNALCEVICFD